MPSISYIDDQNTDNDSGNNISSHHQAPQPPTRYDANHEPPLRQNGGSGTPEFDKTRSLVTAAQIMALVSLLFGGIILSSAAVIVAVLASRKIKAKLESQGGDHEAWAGLKRSVTAAIVMAVIALVANTVALAILYPVMIEALQTGDLSSIMPGSPQAGSAPSGSGTSTWG